MTASDGGTVRLEATVRGRVQGVGYRYFALRRAQALGLAGWVANAQDGTVRVVAEGLPAAVDELERDLGRGPTGAVVEDLGAVRMPATGTFSGFVVRSGGHIGD